MLPLYWNGRRSERQIDKLSDDLIENRGPYPEKPSRKLVETCCSGVEAI